MGEHISHKKLSYRTKCLMGEHTLDEDCYSRYGIWEDMSYRVYEDMRTNV